MFIFKIIPYTIRHIGYTSITLLLLPILHASGASLSSHYQLFNLEEVKKGSEKKKTVYYLNQENIHDLSPDIARQIPLKTTEKKIGETTCYTLEPPKELLIKEKFYLLVGEKIQLICPHINADQYIWKVEPDKKKVEPISVQKENELITNACWGATALFSKHLNKHKKVEFLLDTVEKTINEQQYINVLQFEQKRDAHFTIAKKYVLKQGDTLGKSSEENHQKISLHSIPLKLDNRMVPPKKEAPKVLDENSSSTHGPKGLKTTPLNQSKLSKGSKTMLGIFICFFPPLLVIKLKEKYDKKRKQKASETKKNDLKKTKYPKKP